MCIDAEEARNIAKSVLIRRERVEKTTEKIERMIYDAAQQGDFSIRSSIEGDQDCQYIFDTLYGYFASRGYAMDMLGKEVIERGVTVISFELSWEED